MNPITITIAQTLKPVDDTRAFEKIACSITKRKSYEVNIIGFPSKNLEKKRKINYHFLPTFRRLSITRLMLQFIVFNMYRKQRPRLVITSSPELLIITVLYKLLFSCKMIYDIRENHALNIVSQGHYAKIVTPLIAFLVRMIETFSSYFCDHILLAESCYEHQLKFIHHSTFDILENKLSTMYQPSDKKSKNYRKLVFTGNLSETSGVMRAIELVKKIRFQLPDVTLTIIGHAPLKSFYKELKTIAETNDHIALVGGNRQVSHGEIMNLISSSNIMAIVSYQINPSNKNKLPTKIYEYLGMGIPYLTEESAHWTAETSNYPHCIPINFETPDVDEIVKRLNNHGKLHLPKVNEAFWNVEETLLLKIVEKVLS